MTSGAPFDDVLAAARANAGWAFARIHKIFAPPVTAYVRMQGLRDADDVVNEVFLAAFRGLASFEGDETRFRRWLFTIAHHRVVDARRAHARSPRTEELDAAADRAAPGRPRWSPEDAAVAACEEDRIRAVLGRLSPEQREVIVLRVLADLPVEQVAKIVGKRPGAVRALQHRALATLRRLLAVEPVTF